MAEIKERTPRNKVKIIGVSNNKNWITNIVKDGYVNNQTEEMFYKMKRSAENKMKMKYKKSFQFFYGTTKISGKWGTTFLIWPTTPMSRKHKEVLVNSMRGTKFKSKESIINSKNAKILKK